MVNLGGIAEVCLSSHNIWDDGLFVFSSVIYSTL